MSKQQCEICGQWKEQQEMAKSYKHRCKECVARLTRIDRKAAKQQAEHLKQLLEGTGYEVISTQGRSRTELLNIATAAMQGMLSNPKIFDEGLTISQIDDLAQTSICCAEALLKKIERKGYCNEND